MGLDAILRTLISNPVSPKSDKSQNLAKRGSVNCNMDLLKSMEGHSDQKHTCSKEAGQIQTLESEGDTLTRKMEIQGKLNRDVQKEIADVRSKITTKRKLIMASKENILKR